MVVALGVVAAQAAIYGPSLVGAKVLLPLEVLALPRVYLPHTPPWNQVAPADLARLDPILFYEPARRYAVSEIRAGRLPLWSPYRFAGAPCYRWTLSPPWLLGYLIESPVVLAWTEMLIALVAGIGAYAFFRGVLQVAFWPATIAAWCYPLSGAYIYWQGFWLPAVMCWLPWVLLAVDSSVRRPLGWGGPGLAAVTGMVLLGGAADIAGQMLIASGIYAVWCYFDQYGKLWIARRAWPSPALTALAWTLGIAASACLLWPMIEYTATGARAIRRHEGAEERPPMGVSALPPLVMPEMYGATREGSCRVVAGALPESSSSAYAGLLATLLVAPLGWCSRKHRSINGLWVVLVFIALSWTLNVPGMVQLLRLPGLNIMSHNRFVYVASFAILALAAVGLDALGQRHVARRWWFALPMLLMALVCAWAIYRTLVLPEPIATRLGVMLKSDPATVTASHVHDMADVAAVQSTFTRYYAVTTLWAAAGTLAWLLLWAQAKIRAWLLGMLGAMLIGELLWFSYGRVSQCDPALYYPRIPVLEQLANNPAGRVIGFGCLPANLAQVLKLRDVRGYDGVDPERFVALLRIAANKRTPRPRYAETQWLTPDLTITTPHSLRLPPILDMLGVRYLIFSGSPPRDVRPDFQGEGYWVLINGNALPRVFVPRRVEIVEDDAERLEKLASSGFDPRQVAYVESPLNLPKTCRGSAAITEELPTRITISLNLQTPGLLVLADRWDAGWKAYLEGEQVPILCTNHALRGVAAPSGQTTLQFRYQPASLQWGASLSGLALFLWLAWVSAIFWSKSGPRKCEVACHDPKARARRRTTKAG